MAFGVGKILGIEIGSSRIYAVQGALAGQRLKVFDFAADEIVVSHPENIAQQLEALVGRKRFAASAAALSLSGPGVAHRLLDFPSMPLSELGAVIAREMKSLGEVRDGEMVFDWEVVEETEAGGLKQRRVLVAMAPKSQVDTALGLLKRCRLRPVSLTTAPIALLRSLRFFQGQERGSRAVFYTEKERGFLLGTKEGVWSFFREFSSGSPEALVGEAMREAHRAMLYFRQRYREDGEITFLLAGESGLEELRERLRREMAVEGETVGPGSALDLTPLQDRAGLFRGLFPSLVLPLGLLAAAGSEAGVNLAPEAVKGKATGRSLVDFSWVRPWIEQPALPLIALLVIFGMVHFFLGRAERRYHKLLEERKLLYAQWLPAIQAAEQGRGLREQEKLLSRSIGLTSTAEVSWVRLFKTISLLAPPELVLHSMSLQRDKDSGGWLVLLKGQVVSIDPYTAQAAFNRFYQGLKGFLYLERIELLPLRVSTFIDRPEGEAKKGAVKPEPAGAEAKKSRVQFEIRGYSRGI